MSQMSLAVPMLTDEQRANIHDSRSPYSAEDRLCAVMAYVVSGGKGEEAARKASVSIGQELKAGTLRQWKARAPWWEEAEGIARKMLQQDLDRKYTRFLHVTEEAMLERVQNGNTQLDKAGEPVRVPVGLRDLVTAHGVVSDKRAMLRGEPTSRKEDTGVDIVLKLAAMLEEQGREKIANALPGSYEVVQMDDPQKGTE